MQQALWAQPVPGGPEDVVGPEKCRCGDLLDADFGEQLLCGVGHLGGGDVLHRPLTVGAEGSGTPIELTLRDNGAEVLGKVQFPESASTQKSNEGVPNGQMVYIYFLPLGENAGQFRQTQVWQNGMLDEKQIAPGTYRISGVRSPEHGNRTHQCRVAPQVRVKGHGGGTFRRTNAADCLRR